MTRRPPLASRFVAVAFVCSSAAFAHSVASDPAKPYGVWKNPAHSLEVTLAPCGQKLCGAISWASPKAIDDARKAGYTPSLIGTELLQDYVDQGHGQWKGRVFIPDMGGTFYSKIRTVNAMTLDISGCILGGLICRHQTWKLA